MFFQDKWQDNVVTLVSSPLFKSSCRNFLIFAVFISLTDFHSYLSNTSVTSTYMVIFPKVCLQWALAWLVGLLVHNGRTAISVLIYIVFTTWFMYKEVQGKYYKASLFYFQFASFFLLS